jgi:hypothetical protein
MAQRPTGPYWIRVKYFTRCKHCKLPIRKGEEALYNPTTKQLLCAGYDCGRKEEETRRAINLNARLYGQI